MKYLLKALKYALSAACVLMIGFLIYSLVIRIPPGIMTELIWTDKLVESYIAEPDAFEVRRIRAIDDDDFPTPDGRFSFKKIRYIPDADQWQITVSYNDSTVKQLSDERGVPLSPQDEVFFFTLTDENGRVYDEYGYIGAHKIRHSYRRLIFDEIEWSEVSELTLSIYYTGDIHDGVLPEKAYATSLIYDSSFQLDIYDDKDARAPLDNASGLLSSAELIQTKSEGTGDDT